MAAFKAGEVDVLVATQRHRGRHRRAQRDRHDRRGRRTLRPRAAAPAARPRRARHARSPYCLLFSPDAERSGAAPTPVCKALLETDDGFELADRDLEIRGEGQLFGTRQSGLPDLKLAKLTRDREAVVRARGLAREILDADPQLGAPRRRAAGRRRARPRSATSSPGC